MTIILNDCASLSCAASASLVKMPMISTHDKNSIESANIQEDFFSFLFIFLFLVSLIGKLFIAIPSFKKLPYHEHLFYLYYIRIYVRCQDKLEHMFAFFYLLWYSIAIKINPERLLMSDYINLNSRQAAILDFIKQEIKDKGYPPSVREIGEAIGLSSPSTVHMHLTALEKKGYIHRSKSKNRALEVYSDEDTTENGYGKYDKFQEKREMVDVPIMGQISAGLPMFAEENIEETFPVPLDFIHSNKRLFMLRVYGESMIEAGIYNGDYLIVEEASSASNGEIIVALIDDEATVKTFYRENGYIRLQPENSSMSPIIVNDVKIIGKPIGLFRRF